MEIQYTFLTTQEILKQISYFSSDNILFGILLCSVIFGIFIFILYIYPVFSIAYKHIIKQRKKTQRKLLIKQIAMQREIEEEIEKEL